MIRYDRPKMSALLFWRRAIEQSPAALAVWDGMLEGRRPARKALPGLGGTPSDCSVAR
jgi:hypothetical protein